MTPPEARLTASPRACVPVRHRHLRGRRGLRGGSLLVPLAAVVTAAALATASRAALSRPHMQLADTLTQLRVPVIAADASPAFGACGDICAAGGGCRHVVLRDGLHNGSRVPLAVLQAAETCR